MLIQSTLVRWALRLTERKKERVMMMLKKADLSGHAHGMEEVAGHGFLRDRIF